MKLGTHKWFYEGEKSNQIGDLIYAKKILFSVIYVIDFINKIVN